MPKNENPLDPFGPPIPHAEVACLHCEKVYHSSKMYERKDFWYCGTPGCDGKGYGFDIFPVDEEFVKHIVEKNKESE